MSDLNQPRGRVTIYACGGAGINIVSSLEGKSPPDNEAFAEVTNYYLDTSRSNFINRNLPSDRVFALAEADGAGKDRSVYAPEIKDRRNEILQNYPPADLSIFVSSATGGSGAVFAQILGKELLSQGKPVIFFTIGTVNSKTEIDNTIATIKTFEGYASRDNLPVVADFPINSEESPRNAVNDYIRQSISSLMMLYSRQNAELDSRDLWHWLRFTERTTFEPQLAGLQILGAKDLDRVNGDIISVATLTTSTAETSKMPVVPEYHCEGFPIYATEESKRMLPRHYIITSNYFSKIIKHLNQLTADAEARRKARTKRTTLLSNNDAPSDDDIFV